MTEKPSPESPSDRAVESEPSPMARFTDLARRLVTVSPKKVAEEQAKYDESEDKKRRPRLTPN